MIRVHSKKYLHVIKTLLDILGAKYAFSRDGLLNLYFGEAGIDKYPALWIPEGERLKESKKFRGIPVCFFSPAKYEFEQVYWSIDDKPVFYKLRNKNLYVLRLDIISSSAFFLSLTHESDAPEDKHGRRKKPPEFKLDKPIINHYVLWLKEAIRLISDKEGFNIEFEPLWGKYSYAVILTHDVDYLGGWRFWGFFRAFEEVRRGNLKNALKVKFKSLNPFSPNPLWSFERLVKIEKEFGAGSTFFFLDSPGNFLTAYLKGTSTYSIDTKELKMLFKFLKSEGKEISLHGSYDSYKDGAKLRKEKEHLESVLGEKVHGIRQHYLRFSYPETWLAQSEANFKYDSTLAYAESPGFRSAIAAPYYPPMEDKIIPILEFPLHLMDRTFTKYKKSDIKRSFFEEIEKVKEVNGLTVILWHNSSVDELGFSGYWNFYHDLLKHLVEDNAWVTDAISVYDWWMSRIKSLRES